MVTIRAAASFKRFNEGVMIAFGSWVAVADWDDQLHWYLADDIAPDSTPVEPAAPPATPQQ